MQLAPLAPAARPLQAVRPGWLLAPYAVVPLSLLFVTFDTMLGGDAREVLPRQPEDLLYFSVFFNLPHIVASHLIFADAEYARAYRRRWLWAVAALVPITALVTFLGPAWAANVFFVATNWHVLSQQLGLAGAQLRQGGRALGWWKALSLLVGLACYYWVAPESWPGGWVRAPLGFAATLAIVPWALLAARLFRQAAAPRARAFLAANQLLLLSMVITALAGYPFFSVLMPRVVHDLTAFYVYGVHDTNRNAGAPRGLLHRLLAPLGLPSWVIHPAAAVLLALWVQRVASPAVSAVLIFWLGMLHYHFERVVWKRGSPHRQWAPFA